MVAKSGRGWKLAPCLIAAEAEADRLAPRRNRKADGSIGDQAHQSRTSDHNPVSGWVCAIDLTHDPAGGFDAHARARMAVARHDHRIKYVISNGQIARSYSSRVTSSNRAVNRGEERNGHIPPWVWANYTGSNPHRHHAHFSVRNEPAARDDTSPWWPTTTPAPPEDDVTPDDIDKIADEVTDRIVLHLSKLGMSLLERLDEDRKHNDMLRDSLADLLRELHPAKD